MGEKVDSLLVLKQGPKLTEQEKGAIERINAFFELHVGTPTEKEDKSFLETLDPQRFKEATLQKAATEAKAARAILKKYSTVSFFLEDQRPSPTETAKFVSVGVTLELPGTSTSIELQRNTDIANAIFVDKGLLVFENNVSRGGKIIGSGAKFRDLATGKFYLIERAQSTPAEKRTYTIHPENTASTPTTPDISKQPAAAPTLNNTKRGPEYAYIDEAHNIRIIYTTENVRLPCVVSKDTKGALSYVVAGHPITFDKSGNASYIQGEKTKVLLRKNGENIEASFEITDKKVETSAEFIVNLGQRPLKITHENGGAYYVSYKTTPSLEDPFKTVPFVYEGYTITQTGNTYTAIETPALKELNTLKDQLYTTYHISVCHTIAGPDSPWPREIPDSRTDMANMLETLKTLQSTLARYYTPQEIQQGGLGSILLGKNVGGKDSSVAGFYTTEHNSIILDIFKNKNADELSDTLKHELEHYFDANDSGLQKDTNLSNENMARDMLDQIEGNEQILQLTHIVFIINNDYAAFSSPDNKKSKDIILNGLKDAYLDPVSHRIQRITDKKKVMPNMLLLSTIETNKAIYDQFRTYVTELEQNTLANAQPSLYAMSSIDESDAEFSSSLLDTKKLNELIKNCSPYPATASEIPLTPAQLMSVKIELQTGCKLKWNGNTCIGFDRKLAWSERSERPYSNKEEAIRGARKTILGASQFPVGTQEYYEMSGGDKQKASGGFNVSLNIFSKGGTEGGKLLDELLNTSVCTEAILLKISTYLDTKISVTENMHFCRNVWQSVQAEKSKRMFTGPHFAARSARGTKGPAYRNGIKDNLPTLPRVPADKYIERICAMDEYTDDEIRLQTTDGTSVQAIFMISTLNSVYTEAYIREIYPTPPEGFTFEELSDVLTPKILSALSPKVNSSMLDNIYLRTNIGVDFLEAYKNQTPLSKDTLQKIKHKLFASLINQKGYGPDAIKRLLGTQKEQMKSKNMGGLDQNPKIATSSPEQLAAITQEARWGIDGDGTPIFGYNGSSTLNAKDLYTKVADLSEIDLFSIQGNIFQGLPTQLLYHTLFESNRMLTPEDLLANPFGERLLILLGYKTHGNEVINMLHATEKGFIAYCYGVLKMTYELSYRPSAAERTIRDPKLTIAQKKQQLQSIEDAQFPHKGKTKADRLAYMGTPDYRAAYQSLILLYAKPYANVLKCEVGTSNILLGLTGSKNTTTPTGIGNYEGFGTGLINFADKPSRSASASIDIGQKNDKDVSFCLTAYGIEDTARESQTTLDTIEVNFGAYTLQMTYDRSTNTFAFQKGTGINMGTMQVDKLTDKQGKPIATLNRGVVTISKDYLPSSGFIMVKATTTAPDDVRQMHIACEKPVKSLTKEVLAFSLSESIVTFDSNTATIHNAETVVADVQNMLSSTLAVYNKSNGTTYASLNEYLQKNTSTKIYLVGHTDSDGDDDSNIALSLKRSEAVKQLLLTNAIIDTQFADRIVTSGSGESQPITDNTNPDNKRKNRRVEMMVF